MASAQSSDHGNASLASLAEWQSFSNSPFRFSFGSGAHLAIYTSNAGNTGYDGLTTSTCYNTGLVIDTWSGYNTHYTSGYADPKKQSVMVHELGHSLGLAHAGSLANCTNLPVMFYATPTRYDTCGKKTPQTDDINGIWAIY